MVHYHCRRKHRRRTNKPNGVHKMKVTTLTAKSEYSATAAKGFTYPLYRNPGETEYHYFVANNKQYDVFYRGYTPEQAAAYIEKKKAAIAAKGSVKVEADSYYRQ